MPWNIHLTKLSWISLLGDGENRCFLLHFFALPCYELNGDKHRTCRPTHGFFLCEFGGRKESSVPVFMISWIIIET